ncbi:IS4 family transposase, partial [Cupriavidus sp. AcVe19-6a]|uniref:IS4 family transposase n=1 Tax=Cupriavidus sp. AcVe19-6a TaxID=2821358 RepID=UPI00273A2CD8
QRPATQNPKRAHTFASPRSGPGQPNRPAPCSITRRVFFHVLKNGCRIEALQLASMERLERALALFMVGAWRIARLMRLGRTCPELEAQLLFEPDEWQAAFILNRKEPPETPPSLNEVVSLVARLGGFLARKGDGDPGVKTIWQGLQRVMDFAAGIKYAREIGHE